MIFKYAVRNIYHHKRTNIGLFLILMIFSLSLFIGTAINTGLDKGMEETMNRLGADALLVPERAVNDYMDMLLISSPSIFYMDRSVEKRLEGITYSPQVYLKTLKASCCSAPLQVIAYDPETDFTLKPFLKNKGEGLVVGSNVSFDETIMIFGREYPVGEKLEVTGSGLDSSVYVPFEYLDVMFQDSLEKGARYPFDDISTVYSVIMVKGEAPEIDGLSIVTSDSLVTKIAGSLKGVCFVIKLFLAIMTIATGISVYMLGYFSISFRSTEFSIYRFIGLSKMKTSLMTFWEFFISGLIGSITGICIICPLTGLYGKYLQSVFNVPYVSPSVSEMAICTIKSFLIPMTVYILPVVLSIAGYNRMESHTLYRKGESI